MSLESQNDDRRVGLLKVQSGWQLRQIDPFKNLDALGLGLLQCGDQLPLGAGRINLREHLRTRRMGMRSW